MPLQVAESAVVGEHVEAVARPLERAPRSVPPVGPDADVRTKQLRALVRVHPPHPCQQLIVGLRRD